MKTPTEFYRAIKSDRGYVLMIVMVLACAGAVLMAVALDWSSKNATFTSRNNEYYATAYAAEAATERAFGAMSKDYQNYGEGVVYAKLTNYMAGVPNVNDGVYWAKYRFSNGQGVTNKLFLNRVNPTNYVLLGPPYAGLHALAATYQIIANAQDVSSSYQIKSGVGQEINLGTIPLFQFAIFYQEDLEINPGATMNIRGLVHGNRDIYLDPGAALTFSNDVSASGNIIRDKKQGDPNIRTGTVDFKEYHLSGTSPLNLPVGTNTTAAIDEEGDNVHAILEVPPSGESATSETGKHRLYNQADLILLVSNNVVSVKSGVNLDNSATTVPASQWGLFLQTNQTFVNKRENIDVQAVTIDVNKLRLWSKTNQSVFGNREIQSIYVADLRPTSNAITITNFTITTNYVRITNTTPATNLVYPATNTYLGAVNNTSTSTNADPPKSFSSPPAFNVVTNKTKITGAIASPASGFYVGPITITTNQVTKSSTKPASIDPPITYLFPVTTNSGSPKTYTYKQLKYNYTNIDDFTYSLPAYSYNKITGITTNTLRSTNYYYSTNYTIFAESGVVLTNGKTLPSLGFTVVTPEPIYIMGDYNISLDNISFYRGTGDTSHSRPAAVMADSVMILSTNWNPANSGSGLSSRIAGNTTVNTAMLAGIVPTYTDSGGTGYYSGGVENFPRFLENWANKTITYNGSMTVLFLSRVATSPWGGSDVYSAPNRNWAFDNNFMDQTKIPPLTPRVISVTKGKWSLITPNTTSF